MKPVEIEQKIEGNGLQQQKEQQYRVSEQEKINIAHGEVYSCLWFIHYRMINGKF
jgi:hypothetical protein